MVYKSTQGGGGVQLGPRSICIIGIKHGDLGGFSNINAPDNRRL